MGLVWWQSDTVTDSSLSPNGREPTTAVQSTVKLELFLSVYGQSHKCILFRVKFYYAMLFNYVDRQCVKFRDRKSREISRVVWWGFLKLDMLI